MGRVAGFIDGGFLKKAGAKALGVGDKFDIDPVALVDWVRNLNPFDRKDELLRVYWYEGEYDSDDKRHPGQRRYFDFLESAPGLEVRTGYLVERIPAWHYPLEQALKKLDVDLVEFKKLFEMKPELTQKGVDALITLDLVQYADKRAYDWALLMAGDKDLVEAVYNVQDEGRHVVIAAPTGAGVAPELRRAADHLVEVKTDVLSKILKVRERPPKEPPPEGPAAAPA